MSTHELSKLSKRQANEIRRAGREIRGRLACGAVRLHVLTDLDASDLGFLAAVIRALSATSPNRHCNLQLLPAPRREKPRAAGPVTLVLRPHR